MLTKFPVMVQNIDKPAQLLIAPHSGARPTPLRAKAINMPFNRSTLPCPALLYLAHSYSHLTLAVRFLMLSTLTTLPAALAHHLSLTDS